MQWELAQLARRQEVSTTNSTRVEGSSPVRDKFLLNLFFSNVTFIECFVHFQADVLGTYLKWHA